MSMLTFTKFNSIVLAAGLLLSAVQAHAAETDCLSRDPSTIVKRNGTYWIYGTGTGTQQYSSKDRIHWTFRGPALKSAPNWVASAVPGNTINKVWAPDIRYFNRVYHLYSAYSCWGSASSGINLSTSTDLNPNTWQNQGLVVRTTPKSGANAIDPCIFQDSNGTPWLSYGSYFSGIKLIKLDFKTGKSDPTDTATYNIATRPGIAVNPIEASCVTLHDGYFYLFVNWDFCCRGRKSNYNIRFGRSKLVTGPYLDKHGHDMEHGGGSLFLAAVNDDGSGRPSDDEVGPGHVGILHDTGGDWVTTCYEWAHDKDGRTTVNINKLVWDTDGWPRVVHDPGPFELQSFDATHEALSVRFAVHHTTSLQMEPARADKGQLWEVRYRGEGFYSIAQANGGNVLTGVETTPAANTPLTLMPFTGSKSQLWYASQNDDGTYSFKNTAREGSMSIGITDCSINDGAVVQETKSTDEACQKWMFRRPQR